MAMGRAASIVAPGGRTGEQTLSDSVSLTKPERVAFSRLLWVGPLTIVAAVAANVAFVAVANPLLGVSPDFPPLTLDAIAVFTAIGVLAAVVVFGLVARVSKQPIRRYRQIAL